MRVIGNIIPETIHMEPYAREPGKVEIRLRENIVPITQADEVDGTEYTMYQYDEYIFRLPDRPGLLADIESNLPDYLATGRVLEVNMGASIVADLQDSDADKKAALNELGVYV